MSKEGRETEHEAKTHSARLGRKSWNAQRILWALVMRTVSADLQAHRKLQPCGQLQEAPAAAVQGPCPELPGPCSGVNRGELGKDSAARGILCTPSHRMLRWGQQEAAEGVQGKKAVSQVIQSDPLK